MELSSPDQTYNTQEHTDFTHNDIQSSNIDIYKRYYGLQTMEQAMRLFESKKGERDADRNPEYEPPTIFEQMQEESASVHRTRMVVNYLHSLDTRTVTLHRKRFFDDQCEKLVLMYVQLKFVQKEINESHFSTDVEAFNVIVQEPESGQEQTYVTGIAEFLTQEEFQFEQMNGNLRDKGHLKKLAKKFLEERVEIKRIYP
jgi:hypothetical protein